ncbi:MAG TPA: hypothetical protein VGH31_02430 [Acidimicrobiales bacterium]|jgi:hypothetical protein
MADGQSVQPGDVTGLEEVTALLEVSRGQVQVLIEAGLLNSIGGPGAPRFYRCEVIAAREQGG